ncbi:hypothetical protein M569_09924, partial [Genlisea aurea]
LQSNRFVVPSLQQPQLDMQRAESSKQHVRALNRQFASWIQTQLQNHPDELWEDGVQDYLNHAKGIMETFSDVVNWLKANAAKGTTSAENHSVTAPVKLTSQSEKNSRQLEWPGFSDGSSGNSFGRGPFLNNNNPSFAIGGNTVSLSGNVNSVPLTDAAPDEADGEGDVEEPSSPSLKRSEEKGITTIHEVKCKLYVKSSDPTDKDAWKDRGMGQLSIKCKEGHSKGSKDSKPTIVMRNDVGKLVLNASVYPDIKTKSQKNSIVVILHTADGNENDGVVVVARTYLIRTKNEEERDKLAAAIKECAPPSSSI